MKKVEELARRLYEAYADAQQWERASGASMPSFPELSIDERRRWMLLALDAYRIGLAEEG